MAPTFIIECTRCGGLLLAATDQKTRSCPYCGTSLDLRRVRQLASARSASEASEMLRKIKSERRSNVRKRRLQ